MGHGNRAYISWFLPLSQFLANVINCGTLKTRLNRRHACSKLIVLSKIHQLQTCNLQKILLSDRAIT